MGFIFYEDLEQSLAEDFRSEYVRHELSPERKAELLRTYGYVVAKAYDSAREVVSALE